MPRITKSALSAAASAMSRMRKTKAGGRPAVPRTCPKCGGEYGAHAMKAHVPQCAGPVPATKGRKP